MTGKLEDRDTAGAKVIGEVEKARNTRDVALGEDVAEGTLGHADVMDDLVLAKAALLYLGPQPGCQLRHGCSFNFVYIEFLNTSNVKLQSLFCFLIFRYKYSQLYRFFRLSIQCFYL